MRCLGFLGALGPRTEARVAFVREGNLGHFVRVAFAREVFKKSVERAIGGLLTTIYIYIYIYVYIYIYRLRPAADLCFCLCLNI